MKQITLINGPTKDSDVLMCSAVADKWSGAAVDAGRRSDGAGQMTIIVP